MQRILATFMTMSSKSRIRKVLSIGALNVALNKGFAFVEDREKETKDEHLGRFFHMLSTTGFQM